MEAADALKEAEAALRRAEPAIAIRLAEEALRTGGDVLALPLRARLLRAAGRGYREHGQSREAAGRHLAASAAWDQGRDPRRSGRSLLDAADAWAREGEPRKATQALILARERFESAGEAEGVRRTVEALARLLPPEPPVDAPLASPILEAEEMARILAIAGELNTDLDTGTVLATALDHAIALTGAERGFLILGDATGPFEVPVARNWDQEAVRRPEGKFSTSVVRSVLETRRTVVLADARRTHPFGRAQSVEDLGICSVCCIPFHVRGRVLGAIYLEDRRTTGRFDDHALAVLETLCRLAALAIRNSQEYFRAVRSLNFSRRLRTDNPYPAIVGASRPMRDLLGLLDRAVETDLPVLIDGESGTGKELVAHALHEHGRRARGPFIAVNCAALSDQVLETELFGHVRGAFTGAERDRDGLIRRATGGVLFLDEVGEMSPKLQAELLRVLEEKTVRPLGAEQSEEVDVRVISATNRDLSTLVESGSFRQDLFYRLNAFTLRLPPLRERPEDIPILVEHILEKAGRRDYRPDTEALAVLLGHPWPGNVRELRNAIDRAVVLSGAGPIRAEHIIIDTPVDRAPLSAIEEDEPGAGLHLNKRQRQLLTHLKRHKVVTSQEYADLVGVSPATGWRDLTDLVQQKVLISQGRGKRTTYRLA